MSLEDAMRRKTAEEAVRKATITTTSSGWMVWMMVSAR
jgi:hypothetical protein